MTALHQLLMIGRGQLSQPAPGAPESLARAWRVDAVAGQRRHHCAPRSAVSAPSAARSRSA